MDGWIDADCSNTANGTAFIEKAGADDPSSSLSYDREAGRVVDKESSRPTSMLNCGSLNVLKAMAFVDPLERLVHDQATCHDVSRDCETDIHVHL